MNSSRSILFVSTLVLGMGSICASADVQAATVARQDLRNPVDVCQSALPVFDAQIRKRPKAVQNEGTSSAFVTCSFPSQGATGADTTNPTSVEVWFAVNDGVADSISCTGVVGANGTSLPSSVKTVALAASGSQSVITWAPADFATTGNLPSGLFSVSCELNPGVGINDSRVFFREEIGT